MSKKFNSFIIKSFEDMNDEFDYFDDETISPDKLNSFMTMNYVSLDSLFCWIDSELKYKNSQKNNFSKGYFNALEKLRDKLLKE